MRIAGSTALAASLAAEARTRDGAPADSSRADRATASTAAVNGAASPDGSSAQATAPATASAPVAPLQTAVIQPALRALRAMPDDIDVERVAALRDAIARGEVPFDAARLAGLIQRFHGRTR
jgi:negative regulator of flagellin synthesis FlgM